MPLRRTRRAVAGRRRARRLDRVVNDLTDEQWELLCVAWCGCAYCGAANRTLQRDCVLPIARGGRYTLSNVVPACGPCNASKCGHEVTGWLRRKGLDERAFLIRHAQIVAPLWQRFATQAIEDDSGSREAAFLLAPSDAVDSAPGWHQY